MPTANALIHEFYNLRNTLANCRVDRFPMQFQPFAIELLTQVGEMTDNAIENYGQGG